MIYAYSAGKIALAAEGVKKLFRGIIAARTPSMRRRLDPVSGTAFQLPWRNNWLGWYSSGYLESMPSARATNAVAPISGGWAGTGGEETDQSPVRELRSQVIVPKKLNPARESKSGAGMSGSPKLVPMKPRSWKLETASWIGT